MCDHPYRRMSYFVMVVLPLSTPFKVLWEANARKLMHQRDQIRKRQFNMRSNKKHVQSESINLREKFFGHNVKIHERIWDRADVHK